MIWWWRWTWLLHIIVEVLENLFYLHIIIVYNALNWPKRGNNHKNPIKIKEKASKNRQVINESSPGNKLIMINLDRE